MIKNIAIAKRGIIDFDVATGHERPTYLPTSLQKETQLLEEWCIFSLCLGKNNMIC